MLELLLTAHSLFSKMTVPQPVDGYTACIQQMDKLPDGTELVPPNDKTAPILAQWFGGEGQGVRAVFMCKPTDKTPKWTVRIR